MEFAEEVRAPYAVLCDVVKNKPDDRRAYIFGNL